MRSTTSRFHADESGVLGVVMAISVIPIVGTVMAAIDLESKTTNRASVDEIVETACSRVLGPTFVNAPVDDRQTAALDVLNHLLPTSALVLADTSYAATDTGTGLTITVDGEFGTLSVPFAGTPHIHLTRNCDDNGQPAAPPPGIVFFEGFETPDVRDSGYWGWYVEPNLPDWTLLNGTGAQLIRINIGDPLTHEGFQFMELDGDMGRGAVAAASTNSSIARTVRLFPGTYRLTYAYHRHPFIGSAADQEIAVFVTPVGDTTTPFDNQVASTSSKDWGWQNVTVDLPIDAERDYQIVFSAKGDANRAGGYLDAISLERLP